MGASSFKNYYSLKTDHIINWRCKLYAQRLTLPCKSIFNLILKGNKVNNSTERRIYLLIILLYLRGIEVQKIYNRFQHVVFLLKCMPRYMLLNLLSCYSLCTEIKSLTANTRQIGSNTCWIHVISYYRQMTYISCSKFAEN